MEKTVENIMGHFRKLFGLPECQGTGVAWCPNLKQIKVDEQYIAFCNADNNCKKGKKEEDSYVQSV